MTINCDTLQESYSQSELENMATSEMINFNFEHVNKKISSVVPCFCAAEEQSGADRYTSYTAGDGKTFQTCDDIYLDRSKAFWRDVYVSLGLTVFNIIFGKIMRKRVKRLRMPTRSEAKTIEMTNIAVAQFCLTIVIVVATDVNFIDYNSLVETAKQLPKVSLTFN
jgi:hypothetical protein